MLMASWWGRIVFSLQRAHLSRCTDFQYWGTLAFFLLHSCGMFHVSCLALAISILNVHLWLTWGPTQWETMELSPNRCSVPSLHFCARLNGTFLAEGDQSEEAKGRWGTWNPLKSFKPSLVSLSRGGPIVSMAVQTKESLPEVAAVSRLQLFQWLTAPGLYWY